MNERLGIRFARPRTCAVSHAVGLFLVLAGVPAFGQPTIFLVPAEATINAGESITIQIFLENVAPTLLRAYQVEFPQVAAGGVVGTVTHDPQGTSVCGVYQPFVPGNPDECVDGFCVDGGNPCVIGPQCPGIPDIPEFHPSPCIDLSNPDYVLAGVVALPAVSVGPPPRLGSAAVAAGDSVLVTDPKYLGEFVYTASEDAGGVFTLEPQSIPRGTFLRDGGSPPGDIPFTALGSIITVIQCVIDGDCNDGNACTSNTCEDGICVSTPLYDAETECCNPANGNTTLIDDENDCTDDICDAKKGVVTHPPFAVDTPCGDPNSSECDDADTCDGTGGCQPNFVPEGSACGGPADTQCTDPDTCDGAGACQANDAADGSDCDDGAFCNTGEACAGGVCTGGAPLDCGDDVPCTQDACNEKTDACENVLDADTCLIGGICYVTGALNPDNDCEVCDPGQSTSGWSFLPDGALCDDGDPCTGTGAPGIGVDTCDGGGTCSGIEDPECNDDCINAIEVIEGTHTGDNVGAGPDEVEAGCQPNSNNDIWFKYTASCDGPVMVNTSGSALMPSNDTVLSVYDGCDFKNGMEIACDDDSGAGLLAALVLDVVAGEMYFIRVAGFADNVGDIVLNIFPLEGCAIDGACYVDGDVNPANECEKCDPNQSTFAWWPRLKGTQCGDQSSSECDSKDACDGMGLCEDNHKPDGTPCIDDALDCTMDFCITGVCEHPPLPLDAPCGDPTDTECDNPNTCDGAGACLDQFETEGTACGDPTNVQCNGADNCDGTGTCLDNEDPDGAFCDDENACTNDACASAVCESVDTTPEGQCCNPETAELTMIGDGNACTTDVCNADGSVVHLLEAEPPIVEGTGPRVITVTPQPPDSDFPVALLLTSPTFPCLSKFIGADGTLGDTPVFLSPIEWGTVIVTNQDIVPSTNIEETVYHVQADCDGTLTDPGVGVTFIWGDVNEDGAVDFDDILIMLEAFAGNLTVPLSNVDLFPCEPDGVIDFDDILMELFAFAGLPFPCAAPCDAGACCTPDTVKCTILQPDECARIGGDFLGPGTVCVPNPCQ